ncbi:hypothetical protein ACHAXR_004875 [Thalassiosira sp. AJA248-18]
MGVPNSLIPAAAATAADLKHNRRLRQDSAATKSTLAIEYLADEEVGSLSSNTSPKPPTRWIPKGRKSFPTLKSGMLSSLTRKNSSSSDVSHASNHTSNYSRGNTVWSNADLTTLNQELFKETPMECLNIEASPLDSKSILAKIVDKPSSSDLANLAAVRAKEYIDESLFGQGEGTVVDINTWESIQQCTKSEFLIGKHLGKGSFSDVYEITFVALENASSSKRRNSSVAGDVDRLIEAKFATSSNAKTFAMKCLRLKIQTDAAQFIMGVEDLVHETAMLASLDHPNIIKLRGRATTDLNYLKDGYFILLDRLHDNLDDRIASWKKIYDTGDKAYKSRLSLSQLKAAHSIADALSYLHKKKIAYLDLKPSNIGFDSSGVVKLFDFGFAVDITSAASKISTEEEGEGRSHYETNLLHTIYGTPRYMAPEVGLEFGYGLPADVHSFGIVLWEICSLKKPFERVSSADDLQKSVFKKGARPKLRKCWPQTLRDTMCMCWSRAPGDRPSMEYVKLILGAFVRDMSSMQHQSNTGNSLKKSSVFRRSTRLP